MGVKRALIVMRKISTDATIPITAADLELPLHYDVMYYLIEAGDVALTTKYIRYMLQKAIQHTNELTALSVEERIKSLQPRYVLGYMYLYSKNDFQDYLCREGFNSLAHRLLSDCQKAKEVAREKIRRNRVVGAHKV